MINVSLSSTRDDLYRSDHEKKDVDKTKEIKQ